MLLLGKNRNYSIKNTAKIRNYSARNAIEKRNYSVFECGGM